MPTVSEAIGSQIIYVLPGNLQPYQTQCRRLLATHSVITWIREEIPNATTDGFTIGALSPKDQLLILFNEFVSGQEIGWPFPHAMRPESDGIYRFRTDDVRLNGWFPEQGCFVIGSVDFKSNCISDPARDDTLRDEAIAERETLQINDGAFLLGDYNENL